MTASVYTIPGLLAYHLDELDITQQELAQRLGVSDRTLRNVNAGNKRVSKRLLDRIAAILLREWRRRYPVDALPFLSGDTFSADHHAVVNTVLSALTVNRPDMVCNHESSLLTRDARWLSGTHPDLLPFAQEYHASEVERMFADMYQVFASIDFSKSSVFTSATSCKVILRSHVEVEHFETRNLCSFTGYLEMGVKDGKFTDVTSLYDVNFMVEFFRSGATPKPRKSD